MARSRKPDPLSAQVDAETLVKYGPEGSALKSMLAQLLVDRDQGVAVAESTSRGATNAANAAEPRMREIGAATKKELGGARSRIEGSMAGLSPVADAIKAATQRDFAGADARLGMELRRGQEELVSRKLDAASARVSGANAAQGAYRADKGKVNTRILELAREQGAFGQGRYAGLKGERTARETTGREKARDRAARAREGARGREATAEQRELDRRSRERTAGARAGGAAKKVKWSTPQQHGALKDTIDAAVVVARGLRSDGDDRHRAAKSMVNGEPATTVKVPGPDGMPQSVPVPGVSKVSPLAASIALDLVFDRHVSRRNVQELHRRRYQLKRLGYPTGGKSSPYRPSTPPQTPGPNGQQRPT